MVIKKDIRLHHHKSAGLSDRQQPPDLNVAQLIVLEQYSVCPWSWMYQNLHENADSTWSSRRLSICIVPYF